jgi:pimeloyl-ACP methyl ester carboxylesterase
LEVLPEESFVVVGHSMGSLLAKELAERKPELVKQVILLSPPSLDSRKDLKSILQKESSVQSVMALDSWVAPILCHVHEALGRLSFYLVRPFVKSFIPDKIVMSGTLHRWESYNGSLENVVLKTRALELDPNLKNISFIVGSDDLYSKNEQLKNRFENVQTINGDHNFMWSNKEATIEAIKRILY